MPTLRFISPCSPIRATRPPAGDAWLHELKLDGYRLQILKDRREVRVFTRRGAEWTERLAAFADLFVVLTCRSAILDGELVLPDKTGAPDFRGLHRTVASEKHATAAASTLDIAWKLFRPALAIDLDDVFGRIAAKRSDAVYVQATILSNENKAAFSQLSVSIERKPRDGMRRESEAPGIYTLAKALIASILDRAP